MDDDDFDDWEMDDWEEEAFDEDVYDHSELETAAEVGPASFGDYVDEEEFDEPWSAPASVENAEDSEPFDGDGVAAESVVRTDAGGERMGWSAWDVGTVFALGGWLADHHADRTAQQVAAALAERNVGRPANRAALSAAHPPPPSGYPYWDSVGSLQAENPVDQGALYTELALAEARGQDLVIQAEGPVDLDRQLVLIVSAVPGSVGPRFWVVAEETPGGFNPSRLIPVFERSTDGKVAIFATDHAHEAVDAAAWACEREGVSLHEFHVATKQPA